MRLGQLTFVKFIAIKCFLYHCGWLGRARTLLWRFHPETFIETSQRIQVNWAASDEDPREPVDHVDHERDSLTDCSCLLMKSKSVTKSWLSHCTRRLLWWENAQVHSRPPFAWKILIWSYSRVEIEPFCFTLPRKQQPLLFRYSSEAQLNQFKLNRPHSHPHILRSAREHWKMNRRSNTWSSVSMIVTRAQFYNRFLISLHAILAWDNIVRQTACCDGLETFFVELYKI
jgi:hypothetical protein